MQYALVTSRLTPGPRIGVPHLSTRQYGRTLQTWGASSKPAGGELLHEHTKFAGTVRYLGMEVDDAQEIVARTDVWRNVWSCSSRPPRVSRGRSWGDRSAAWARVVSLMPQTETPIVSPHPFAPTERHRHEIDSFG